MYVKRICRPTVREALAEARQQLGPGALVLSTELVQASGWRGWLGRREVRLTAAAMRSADESTAPVVSEPRPPLTAARHLDPVTAARTGVVAQLVATGIDTVLASSIANRMSEAECRHATAQSLRRAIATELEADAAADPDYARCEVFVGPPGVGKTTTIAKIAAQERATNGRTLALVAADAFRSGAIEQLRGYAAIVQSPFRVARSADELADALAAARHPALVDTAGRSAGDEEGMQSLAEVLERRRSVRTHLVLAADTSPAAARRIFDRYAPLHPSRVVITKVDESDSVVPLLGVVRERGLPVSYVTGGQRVPEDLWRATPAVLAATLLGESAMEAPTCH